MLNVFVNIKGHWVELDSQNTINGENPFDEVEKIMYDENYERKFVEVYYDNTYYKISITDIQATTSR